MASDVGGEGWVAWGGSFGWWSCSTHGLCCWMCECTWQTDRARHAHCATVSFLMLILSCSDVRCYTGAKWIDAAFVKWPFCTTCSFLLIYKSTYLHTYLPIPITCVCAPHICTYLKKWVHRVTFHFLLSFFCIFVFIFWLRNLSAHLRNFLICSIPCWSILVIIHYNVQAVS